MKLISQGDLSYMISGWNTLIFDLLCMEISSEVTEKCNVGISITIVEGKANGRIFTFEKKHPFESLATSEEVIEVTAFRWSQKEHYDRLIPVSEVK
jgi:hypothetical protein